MEKASENLHKNTCSCCHDNHADTSCSDEHSGCHCDHDEASEGFFNRETFMTAGAILCFVSAYVIKILTGDSSTWNIVANIAFISAYLLSGTGVLIAAASSIWRRKPFDENFLMSIATLGAFFIGDIGEAAGVMIFYNIGETLQGYAVRKSRGSIRALLSLKPDMARLVEDSGVRMVSPEQVLAGQRIEVRPGEKIPLDSIVESGSSAVNTAAMTGESMPRDVSSGDEVLAGFVNGAGLLILNVVRPADESAISRILKRVDEAAKNKAPSEKFITRFAKIYTPAVVAAAALVAVIPAILGIWTFSDSLYRGLLFLVISCPCALVLSVPLSFFAGLGSASRQGILIKGGNYLELLSNTDIFVFDKTGTLTEGVFEVAAINTNNGFTKEELLGSAALCEARSSHPIAVSVVKAAIANGLCENLNSTIYDSYQDIPGEGVLCEVGGIVIACGNGRLMQRQNVTNFNAEPLYNSPVVHVSIGGKYAGNIEVRDKIRKEAVETLRTLRGLGVRHMAMLSGDTENTALNVAGQLDIDEVFAGLLPEDKMSRLEDIRNAKKGKVLFVGDGVNDAPVLSCADVGLAMGGIGSEAAVEAADIVAMGDSLEALPKALILARRTMRIVKQNVILALGLKILMLILGLFGFTGMWGAIFADVGVALLCVLNALRLIKFNKA